MARCSNSRFSPPPPLPTPPAATHLQLFPSFCLLFVATAGQPYGILKNQPPNDRRHLRSWPFLRPGGGQYLECIEVCLLVGIPDPHSFVVPGYIEAQYIIALDLRRGAYRYPEAHLSLGTDAVRHPEDDCSLATGRLGEPFGRCLLNLKGIQVIESRGQQGNAKTFPPARSHKGKALPGLKALSATSKTGLVPLQKAGFRASGTDPKVSTI